MMEEKKLEKENKSMSDNDVICIVNGEIRNQKDLELWHGVSSYDNVSDFVLAVYMKVNHFLVDWCMTFQRRPGYSGDVFD